MNENIMNEDIVNVEETAACEEEAPAGTMLVAGLCLVGAATLIGGAVYVIKKGIGLAKGTIAKHKAGETEIDIPNEVDIGQDLEEV